MLAGSNPLALDHLPDSTNSMELPTVQWNPPVTTGLKWSSSDGAHLETYVKGLGRSVMMSLPPQLPGLSANKIVTARVIPFLQVPSLNSNHLIFEAAICEVSRTSVRIFFDLALGRKRQLEVQV